MDVPAQEVIPLDNVTAKVDAVLEVEHVDVRFHTTHAASRRPALRMVLVWLL
jgi:hypothetical protein